MGETTDETTVPARRAGNGVARRLTATARNAAQVVRFGGLDTGESSSPFTIEAEQRNFRLRHYYADAAPAGGRPILLIPPLMLTTEVWDVSPRASAVTALHDGGLDTWVVDFGHPDRDPGGLERDLADHVLAVSDAVDRVHEHGIDTWRGGVHLHGRGPVWRWSSSERRLIEK